MRRSVYLTFAPAAVASVLLLTACGDDSPSQSSTEVTEEGHEVVPDAQVTAGLAATEADMAAVAGAQAGGTKATEADTERVEAGWASYEGTIKANEVDAYLAMEDALGAFNGAIERGESDPMTKAVSDFGAAADSYLAKHP